MWAYLDKMEEIVSLLNKAPYLIKPSELLFPELKCNLKTDW